MEGLRKPKGDYCDSCVIRKTTGFCPSGEIVQVPGLTVTVRKDFCNHDQPFITGEDLTGVRYTFEADLINQEIERRKE